MDLSIYNVIKRPHISYKSRSLSQMHQQIVLEVHPHANKPMIEQALKKLFNIEAEKIRVIVRKGKMRRSGRLFTQSSCMKKAIVTLKEGSANQLAQLGQSMPTDVTSESAPAA